MRLDETLIEKCKYMKMKKKIREKKTKEIETIHHHQIFSLIYIKYDCDIIK